MPTENTENSSRQYKEQNLMIVAAVEEYAKRHGISTTETLKLFMEHKITDALRSQYDVLHTQDLSESTNFAEDLLRGYDT